MAAATIWQRLEEASITAVLVIDRADDALPVVEALWAGGIRAIELTLRTPVALEALVRIRRGFPDLLAGVGTILSPLQVQQVHAAGADFGVAPGLNPNVVASAIDAGLPFAPGVCTPSEIERALELDLRVLKFFPAEPSGGLGYLKSIAAPYAHLGIKFLPLGGITQSNLADYVRNPLVAGIGGTWIAPRETIQKQDWAAITAASSQAIAIRDQARNRAS